MGVVAESAPGRTRSCSALTASIAGGTAGRRVGPPSSMPGVATAPATPTASRFNGDAPWRETRSATAADGSYVASLQDEAGGPEPGRHVQAAWRSTVARQRDDAPGCPLPHRRDHRQRRTPLRARRTRASRSNTRPARAGVDYAFNALASGLDDVRSGKVVVMDFNKSVFDFDGWQTATEPDDYLPAKLLSRRHLKKVNAAADRRFGQVVRVGRDASDATRSTPSPSAAPTRAPPSPPPARPTAAGGNGDGNGNGNGNGGGKGEVTRIPPTQER